MRTAWLLLLLGCGRFRFESRPGDAPGAPDGNQDAGTLGPFGPPSIVGNGSISVTSADDQDCTMTGDALELYFSSTRVGGIAHIYTATRTSIGGAWSAPVAVSVLNSASDYDTTPEITRDGLLMWLTSSRAPTNGNDVYATSRGSLGSPWATPVLVPELSVTGFNTYSAQPSVNALTIVFSSDRSGNYDLYIATRGTLADPWNAPQPIGELDTPGKESDPFLSDDGLTIYYTSNAAGQDDLVFATRSSTSATFGAPQPIDELNSPSNEQDIWLSPDARRVIFASNRAGTWDLYEASR